jgi:hypothetical protein
VQLHISFSVALGVDSRLYCCGFDSPDFISGVASSHFLGVGGALDFVRIRDWLRAFSLYYAVRFGKERAGL